MEQTNYLLPDEFQLILKGCLAGERASQAKLYHLYADRMMSVCMWYARNREEAEEVLQDGFMRVFTYLHKFTGEGSFDGWIRKIMVNAALFKYRNKSSKMYVVTEYNTDIHDSTEEASFVSNYDERELMKLVQLLPPAYRMVFNLHVFEGYNHREIAEALGISKGTSKSNLADARRILQASLTVKKKVATM
ncbi:MAG: RNA polymerase sigma factor [Bacteroidetes bacterium]|nr:RNA polymerase sigma factor [Bacteroidota bacterium]